MALVRCRDCNAGVSSQAKICPHCGRPIPSRRSVSEGFVVCTGLILIIGMCAYMAQETEPTSSVKFKPSAKKRVLSLLEQAARDVREYELAKKRSGREFIVKSAPDKRHNYTQAQCDKLSDQGKMVRFWDVIKLLVKRYPNDKTFPHVGQGLTYSRKWHLIRCGKWRYAYPAS